MTVVLTEWEKKYTWGSAIEITANRVVNLLLREENNLIKIDDNEIYTDLQLEDWLTPSDTLPVWVTTWRVLEADGWVKSWTMLCFKTTSWDYVTWIYGDDGKLYIDNWTGTFKQIYLKPEIDALLQALDAKKQDQHIPLTITLATADWSNMSQTVTALWVTSNSSVIVSSTPTSIEDYTSAKIYCSAQGTDSLTFTCINMPSNAVSVNVVVLN